MTRRFKFYREINDWFVDLPEWEGDKTDLQMVAGADSMLDIISQGEDSVWLTISTEPHEGNAMLTRVMICEDEYWQLDSQGCPSCGAFYILHSWNGIRY